MEAILINFVFCGADIHRHKGHNEVHSDFLQIAIAVEAEGIGEG